MSTLAEIRTKVRTLAKVSSVLNMTNDQVDTYINSFYRYDLPQEVELFELRQNITFATTPNLGVYGSTTGNFSLNLKNFKDVIASVNNPIYVSGQPAYLTQDQIEFYDIYSKQKTFGSVGTSDGIITVYNLNIGKSILRRSVVIGSLNNDGEAIILNDEPNTDAFGREAIDGHFRNQENDDSGDINYVTGEMHIEFVAAPALAAPITYELETFTTGIPDTILFFDNKFTLKPIPDKVYEVKIQVEKIPDLLVNDADEPMVNQWSQVIAYGAAIKILQDNADMETVQALSGEFNQQLLFVTRRTSKIRAKETVRTIYNTKRRNNPWNYRG